MTQLIINGTEYPETSHDKYKCYKKQLGKSMRMASGRMVMEVQATITVLQYSYDYFGDELMRQCLKDLRGGQVLTVDFLPPDSEEMQTGHFFCTALPAPTYAFSVGEAPKWHNVSFTLEEERGN